MNFLNELEMHLESFESKAKAEIIGFITYVRGQYSTPANALVAPPAPIAPNGELTIGQPAVEVTPVEAEVAPEVEEPAPVEAVEEAPAETEEPAKAE